MSVLTSALLSGGSIIDLDGTIIVQAIAFFVAFLAVRSLIVKPMIALFEAREAAIDGARIEARTMERDAKDKAASFEEEMQQVRGSAAEQRDRLRAEGAKLQGQVLERVRVETQKQLSEAKVKMDREAASVRADMKTLVPALARQIAEKLLDREVAS